MSTPQYILAIDQGTTSSRAIVFDTNSNIISVAQKEFPQIYPQDGWVEHDPEAIWDTTISTAKQAFDEAESKGGQIVAIGITNQRETTIVWNCETGKPIYNAIVWQDRRTAPVCKKLQSQNLDEKIQSKTGLLIDPYFSATKIAWILDHVDSARKLVDQGKLAFGTIDTFLISRLTGQSAHVTDATNASRTNLFNIHTQSWDQELLDIFNVPESVLPKVLDCAADFGETSQDLFGRSIPIFGVAGDQQAATIGQCCFESGAIKSTYGTGCFVVMNTGNEVIISKNRLLSTVAYKINGQTTYALEGSIFNAGTTIQWLRDELNLFENAKETETLATSINSNNGVYLVPAFTGLGAPYWNPDVRGALFGLTRATGKAEFTRAALESVCYQTHDLLHAMTKDGINPSNIKVDGGMVANNWLVQFLSNILQLPIERPQVMETTALGAAYLAGLQAGLFNSLKDIKKHWQLDKRFEPAKTDNRQDLLNAWHEAVKRVITDFK